MFFINSLLMELIYCNDYHCFSMGMSAAADSPQYSGMATEVGDKIYGHCATIQLAIGFLISIISIKLIPLVVDLMVGGTHFQFYFWDRYWELFHLANLNF